MAHRRTAISQWPVGERPRERLLERGAASLSEAELLAILLGTGHRGSGANALDTGRELLSRFGGLEGLPRAGLQELMQVPGVGPVKVTRILAALELGLRLTSHPIGERLQLTHSLDVYRAYRGRMGGLRREVFMVLLLDARHRVTREVQVSEGGLSSTIVQPREVFNLAIREAAAAILCLHNHPSGDPTPSTADLDLTHRLCAAADLLGIPVVDHIVIGSEGYVSLADQGFMGKRNGGLSWAGMSLVASDSSPNKASARAGRRAKPRRPGRPADQKRRQGHRRSPQRTHRRW